MFLAAPPTATKPIRPLGDGVLEIAFEEFSERSKVIRVRAGLRVPFHWIGFQRW